MDTPGASTSKAAQAYNSCHRCGLPCSGDSCFCAECAPPRDVCILDVESARLRNQPERATRKRKRPEDDGVGIASSSESRLRTVYSWDEVPVDSSVNSESMGSTQSANGSLSGPLDEVRVHVTGTVDVPPRSIPSPSPQVQPIKEIEPVRWAPIPKGMPSVQ